MATSKILVIPGSVRAGSHNVRLAAALTREFALAHADVARLSLDDYALPLYDADLEKKSGTPRAAENLRHMIGSHHGVVFVSPEYNASVPPLLKNAIDWVSSTAGGGDAALAVFHKRAFALASASPGMLGGARGLMALRQVLELGCGALVIPQQVCVPFAHEAFDDNDRLTDERSQTQLRAVVRGLIDAAQRLTG